MMGNKAPSDLANVMYAPLAHQARSFGISNSYSQRPSLDSVRGRLAAFRTTYVHAVAGRCFGQYPPALQATAASRSRSRLRAAPSACLATDTSGRRALLSGAES